MSDLNRKWVEVNLLGMGQIDNHSSVPVLIENNPIKQNAL